MGRTWDDYGEFRQLFPLTPDQRSAIIAAPNEDARLKLYMKYAKDAAQRQFDAAGAENTWDAGDRRKASDALPDDEELVERFPGVDPRGRYSEIDMKLAQRREVIRTTLALRSPETAERVEGLFNHPYFRFLEHKMEEQAREQRLLLRASKLCWNKAAAADLRVEASSKASNEYAVAMDMFYKGVEYMLGIETRPLPKEIEEYIHNSFRGKANPFELKPEYVREGRRMVVPEKVEIAYPDFRTKEVQIQFANPENWGKKSRYFPSLDSDDLKGFVEPFNRAAAGRMLDAMFKVAEEQALAGGGQKNHAYAVDRGDLLIIEGKTVNELLLEQYNNSPFSGKYDDFKAFLTAEGRDRAAEMVSAALTAGKRVEAFIPDSRGRIPDEPAHLTQKGFEPARLSQPSLNAWERFWNKFGFYKEKAVRIEEFAAARERVKLYNRSARVEMDALTSKWREDMFFGDWKREREKVRFGPQTADLPREMGQIARGYSVSRSAWPTLASLKMLADGKPLADILDPDKLQAEKQRVGKELVERISKPGGDPEYEAELFMKGAKAFMEQLDGLAEGLDLTKPETYFSEEFRPMMSALAISYDMFQEMGNAKDVCLQYCAEHGLKPETYQTLYEQIGTHGYIAHTIRDTAYVEAELQSGTLGKRKDPVGDDIGKFFYGKAAVKKFAETYQKALEQNPRATFTQAIGEQAIMEVRLMQPVVCTSGVIESLAAQYCGSPEGRAKVCADMRSGQLERDFGVTEKAPGMFTFGKLESAPAKSAPKPEAKAKTAPMAPGL